MREDKQHSVVGANFIAGTTPQEIRQEMAAFCGAKSLKNPLLHCILSFDKSDSDKNIRALVSEFAARLGVSADHQFLAVMHREKESEKRGVHCHLVVNRVSLSYRVFSDKMIGLRVRDIAKEMNVKHSLRNEYAEENRKEYSHSKNRYDSAKRQAVLERLRGICSHALNQSRSAKEFADILSNQGVSITNVRSKKGNRVVGFRFGLDGYSYKASEVGRAYSLNAVRAHCAARTLAQKEPDVALSPWARQAVAKSSSSPQKGGSILRDLRRLGATPTTHNDDRRRRKKEEEECDTSEKLNL